MHSIPESFSISRAALVLATICLQVFATATHAFTKTEEDRRADDARMKLLDLRVGWNEQRTRIVFDISRMGPYRLLALDNPPRMIIDFPESPERHFDHREVSLRGTPIARIRTGIQDDGTLRYVFDLREHATAKLFPLKPNEQHGARLVLDLFKVHIAEAETPLPKKEPLAKQEAEQEIVAAPPAEDPGGVKVPEEALPQETEAEPVEEVPQLPLEPHIEETPILAEEQPGEPEDMGDIRTPSDVTPDNSTGLANIAGSNAPGVWSGSIGLQSRAFLNDPNFDEQDDNAVSIALEPEYYRDRAQGSQRVALRGFARVDASDSERTHVDLRELYWQIEKERLLFKVGLDVVFWGVTESQHLVDIINQTDLVENPDGEDKLGQPMVNVDYFSDYGTWQAYILPYFRERTFPGSEGRLRMHPAVETDDPLWDSSDEEEKIDYALRWSHYLGDWDIGVAHFTGTDRDPVFVYESRTGGDVLRPLYLQMDQTSLDLQATKGAWLWKVEAIYNQNKMEDYFASVSGFEHTQFGFQGTNLDLGWLLEYHYDERGDDAPTSLQNDIYTGLRLTGNDVAGTRFLAGITVDLDEKTSFGNIEAARRLGESWTITLEARTFFNVDNDDPAYFLRDDDYLELQLDKFF
jgi:AMIN domain